MSLQCFRAAGGALLSLHGGRPSAAATVVVALWHPRRAFIEHSADPTRWRSPDKAEVKRQHPGVRLGSEFARIKERGEAEQQLVDAGKFTDWGMMWRFAVGAAVVLVLLNVLLATVEPNPPPEYTPYLPPLERRSDDVHRRASRP
ncbi:hypothetical protein DQ04_06281030 [Trypanosoma grayi]|uniref:hypothetical protein n=1 Tax=Trypanosoma grayi TaxID=71804 RepID=UPI0004F415C3|nr:hypothetical protein DQ04_06281030 [Trypanosoma grayi]KEG08868.1 hypothetical protein DQ04_06281030 [Trypanosoma grayi]